MLLHNARTNLSSHCAASTRVRTRTALPPSPFLYIAPCLLPSTQTPIVSIFESKISGHST